MEHDARHRAADLTSEIYAALLGTGTWQGFLDNLSGLLPNGKTALFYHDFVSRTGAWPLSSGIDPQSIAAYNGHYSALNPWMAKASRRPLGLGVRAEQMFPRGDLVRTEFYTDFMKPQELETAVGVTVFRDRGCNFMLSTVCTTADDALLQSAAALLEMLTPHLQQAFTYYRRVGRVASGVIAVEAASDALGVAIVQVGFDRHVRWANAAGRDLLSLGDPVGTDLMGRVTARRGEVQEAIDAAIAAALRGEGAGKRSMTLPARDAGGPPARLTLVVPALAASERYFAGASIILLVETPAVGTLPAEEALRAAFALTPSEARLACAVAGGASVADAAAAQGVTRETARTHLKRIFAKMDVHRQAELVAKVLGCQGGKLVP